MSSLFIFFPTGPFPKYYDYVKFALYNQKQSDTFPIPNALSC